MTFATTLAGKIAAWLREQLDETGARGFVFGLSGGVDSAVVAALCGTASPGAAVGVILPCHSDPRDESDAQLVAKRFSLPTLIVRLDGVYDSMVEALDPASAWIESRRPLAEGRPAVSDRRLPLANLKPRLRMAALYFVANNLDSLVVGTGNRSELSIGYFTKYGDGGADLLPLGQLLKSEVVALARDLGVPEEIIEKPPSAGLWLGQTDEGEMGFTYAELESYLTMGPEAVSPAVAARIGHLARSSRHKRAVPPAYPRAPDD
ncbi:MAG: NAD(+) synthase [Vicinamibacterales bacterium]